MSEMIPRDPATTAATTATDPLAGPSKGLEYAPVPPTRFRRASASARRWARETFNREQLAAGLKQLAWVVPLTLLIWVYAEREQQIPANDIRFALEVFTSNPKVDVRLLDPEDGYVSVDLLGPRRRVEELRRELGARSNPVRFEVPADLKPGQQQFPVTLVASRDSRFDGVSVSGGQPQRLTVLVDPIEEETVAIQLREEDRALYDQVVFSPAKVKVRMPRTARARAASLSGGQLVAHGDLATLPDKTPGLKSNVPGVRVAIANAADPDDAVIDPAAVSVTLNVREADKEFTIENVGIDSSGAPKLLNTVDVIMDPLNLFNVRVRGPAEAINEIDRTKAANVRAQVNIDSGDVNAGPRPKDVWFLLPQGVKVQSVDGVPVRPGQQPTVEVTVDRRSDVQ